MKNKNSEKWKQVTIVGHELIVVIYFSSSYYIVIGVQIKFRNESDDCTCYRGYLTESIIRRKNKF